MSIEYKIGKFLDYFNIRLKESLKIFKKEKYNLFDPIDYIMFPGGKRIRPFLLMESYKVFGNNKDEAVYYAIALEMVHTYSLVHDDLPAMDNDDYRRGRLTVHKKYGEDKAILVGDALLNGAYELIAKKFKEINNLNELEKNIEAFNRFSEYAGGLGMIGGQVIDMEIDIEESLIEILNMYSLKTGALFKTATSVGSILGGGSDQDVKKMENFGEKLGLAYQIKDDILDYDEDRLIDKVTVATKIGINKSEKLVEEYTEEALSILNDIGPSQTRRLKKLTESLLNRTY